MTTFGCTLIALAVGIFAGAWLQHRAQDAFRAWRLDRRIRLANLFNGDAQ